MAKKTSIAKKIESKKDIIIELKQISDQATKKDIDKWRKALNAAMNKENPKRYDLFQIYKDNLLDLHLSGAIRNRKLAVLGKNFKITKDGEEIPELTKLLKTKWFKKFMLLSLDSIFWGFSLIQFGDVLELDGIKKFSEVKLVPREHVCPEFHVILREVMDEPKKGVDYITTFANWCIAVGESDDLGILNKVSHETISKRNQLAFWDQFGEIFGMPIRIGKTNSRDKKEIDRVELMMKNMGSAAYGVFPEGTEVEIKESQKGDAFNVYDRRIERANSEMSKEVLGQTMTMDDGSSRSQSEVHLKVLESINWADSDMIKDVVNDDLIPVLNVHGFGFEGCVFDWDDTYEFTQTEMQQVEEMLLGEYDIDPVYFIEKYKIPITGVKQKQINPTQPNPPAEKKNLVKLYHDNINILYHQHCKECGGKFPLVQLAKDSFKNIEKEAERIAQLIYDGKLAAGDIDETLLQLVAKKLRESMIKGYGIDFNSITTDTPDFEMLQNLERNVYQFSTAKNYQQLKELTLLLKNEAGDILEFNDFKKEVIKTHRIYNNDWLRTEYDTAINSSQMAGKWVEFQKNKDSLPFLIYQTAGDKRVRASHKSLDGVQRAINDEFWNSYYPPNGYNCRCTVNQSGQGKETDISKLKYPDVDAMFRTNLAKTGVVFPSDHPYFEGVPVDVLNTYYEKLKNNA